MKNNFSKSSNSFLTTYPIPTNFPSPLIVHNRGFSSISAQSRNPAAPTPLFDGPSKVREGNSSDSLTEWDSWRRKFILVFTPFILSGIPLHLLLLPPSSSGSTLSQRSPGSTKEWFQFIFSSRSGGGGAPSTSSTSRYSCCLCESWILSVVLAVVSLTLNGIVLYSLGQVIYILLIQGQINWDLFEYLLYLIQSVPIILPLDYIWLYGYSLRSLIGSYGRIRYYGGGVKTKGMDEEIGYGVSGSSKLGINGTSSTSPNLLLFYILILITHGIHTIIYLNSSVRLTGSHLFHWLNYWVGPGLCSLVLPVYATFCGATRTEFMELCNYVGTLIARGRAPLGSHFNEIKRGFKGAADRVLDLTKIFNLYLSWVFLVLIISVVIEGFSLISTLLTTMSEMDAEAQGQGQQGSPSELDPESSLPPTTTEAPSMLDNFFAHMFKPSMVRAYVGLTVIVLLKFGLIYLTIWQAVRTNDQIRTLDICLFDFMTEGPANVTLSTEDYQSFRLLIYYIYSRMRPPQATLLRIALVSFIPPLRTRMLGSLQCGRHV